MPASGEGGDGILPIDLPHDLLDLAGMRTPSSIWRQLSKAVGYALMIGSGDLHLGTLPSPAEISRLDVMPLFSTDLEPNATTKGDSKSVLTVEPASVVYVAPDDLFELVKLLL